MFPIKIVALFGIYLAIILAIFLPFLVNTSGKNTCTSYFDYFLINFDGDCYYNPDVDLEVPEILHKYTGSVRVYNVTTSDGYILTMFRIVRENPLGVVLLQPPISSGSIAYLSDGPNSLGIEIWKRGYEIWLTNHRGSSYSRKHLNLTEANPEFWNYSFHEIALYDLDAQFEFIFKKTKSQVTYIGYSMATTEALIYASLKPERAQKFVNSFVLIAPIADLKHLSGPFKYFMYAMKPFETYLRMGEFTTFEVGRWLLRRLTVTPLITHVVTQIVMGWTFNEMDPSLFPYIVAHHGRGISNKIIYHYGQMVFNQNYFLMYDYGHMHNFELYGSETPPHYPLQNIKNSIYLIYGENDRLLTPADVEILSQQYLPKDKVQGKIEIPNHNHVDFTFSRYRMEKTFKDIFQILDNMYIDQSKIL